MSVEFAAGKSSSNAAGIKPIKVVSYQLSVVSFLVVSDENADN
jgi:hypothetical protein